jgi:hypothetical protein
MSKSKKSTEDVQSTADSIVRRGNDDYISIADISKGGALCCGFEVVINVVANNLFSTTTTTK